MLKIQEKTRRLLAGMIANPAGARKKNIASDMSEQQGRSAHFLELYLWKDSLTSQKNKLRELFEMEGLPIEKAKRLPAMDDHFLQKLQRVMETHLSDPDFNVGSLSHEMGLSRVHLHRKLKALTDEPPSDLLRNFRLQKAALLLTQGAGTVSEVAYRTGFNDLGHFSKCFKKVFGLCPSQYQSFDILRYGEGISLNRLPVYQHMLPTD